MRDANLEIINLEYEEEIEDKISDYLKDNISFICFQINEKLGRLRFEEGLIATLNKSDCFRSSTNWLGLNSSKKEIVNSGLWNVQGLNGNPLNKNDINCLQEIISTGQCLKNDYKLENHEKKSNIINKNKPSKPIINLKVSTAEIKNFIQELLIQSKENNITYIEIISGDIHKEMNLVNKMPSVCSAMYQCKKEKDEILHTTESGKSSTIKIRYYLD